jgi:hypothetical protein
MVREQFGKCCADVAPNIAAGASWSHCCQRSSAHDNMLLTTANI